MSFVNCAFIAENRNKCNIMDLVYTAYRQRAAIRGAHSNSNTRLHTSIFSIKLATSIGLSFFQRRSDESNTWQGIRPTKVLQTIKFSLWVDRDNFRVWGV
jgi:hypothetical protein